MGKRDKTRKKSGRIPVDGAGEEMRHNPFAAAFGRDPDEVPPEPDAGAGEASTGVEASDLSDLSGLGRVRLRRERKGRGGKTVTLVEGLESLGDEAREALAVELRRGLGCGSTVEGETIVLQGDQQERAEQWLRKRGLGDVARAN